LGGALLEVKGRRMSITLTLADWGTLFLHFISLSLLTVGGAITTAPDMHRYLVDETRWLSEAQFTSSIDAALTLVPEGWYGFAYPWFHNEYSRLEKRCVMWRAAAHRARRVEFKSGEAVPKQRPASQPPSLLQPSLPPAARVSPPGQHQH
jgi:hypothetical protein